jgi:hypothetical protein
VTGRRSSLASALIALGLALGQVAAQSAYYPQTLGWSWTYSNGATQTLTGTRELAGLAAVVLTHSFRGVPVSEDYLDYSNGVRLLGTGVGGSITTYDPPLLLFPPAPLQVGMRWSTTSVASDGTTLVISISVTGVQGLRTPVGSYNALVIRSTVSTSSGAASVVNSFFVPAVGTVRYVTSDGGTIDLIEMGR